jgi:hypothetical protein
MSGYRIHSGMTFPDMVNGRKVLDNGSAPEFNSLPFAGDPGGWVAPGSTFLWALFDDGSYWCWSEGQHYGLVATPGSVR